MKSVLRNGFRVGRWVVAPLCDAITDADGIEHHLQPKVMNVLVYLASRALEPVTRDELIDAVWGESTATDETLTRVIAELRHALGDNARHPAYIETIPKRGYRFLAVPTAIEGESTLEAPESRDEPPVRRLQPALITAALVIMVLVGAVTSIAIRDPTPQQAVTVAVLPFVAMSDEPYDEYFADGLSEEILNALSQLPDLRVIARSSSFFFKGKGFSLAEIAQRLNAAYIVDGSVRRNGETLRISAHLIRSSDGSQVWSKTYDDDRTDALAVQADVAEHVATILGIVLDESARERMQATRIDDVDTFVAYQKGLEAFARAHGPDADLTEELTVANTLFDSVIDAQPDFTAARLLRADRTNHALVSLVLDQQEPSIDDARDLAEALKAEMDLAWRASPNGNQRDILDLERTLVSDDWTGLSFLIQRAMRPGNCPRINITETITALGFAEALAHKLEESLACDPVDPDLVYNLARTLAHAGRPNEALALLDQSEANGVRGHRFDAARIDALVVTGRFDEPVVHAYLKSEPVTLALLQGNEPAAQQMADRYWTKPDAGIGDTLYLAAMVGDRARANENAARIDRHPGSAYILMRFIIHPCLTWGRAGVARGCRDGIPFDLEATPNFKARIDESGLAWPPSAFRNNSTDAPR